MPVLVIDKPAGLTSFAVVKEVARQLRVYRAAGGPGGVDPKRIGHGGTLDPMATGVLPICIGEATKLAPFLLDAHKGYEASLKLGVLTDTLDAEGQVVRESPVPQLTVHDVETALERFRGPIEQVPPMYSALKRDGKPLYEYAREGVELERKPRAVTIFSLTLVNFTAPDEISVSVHCSKGTYIRVLAADLGLRLGTLAHLIRLRRTVSGPFNLGHAISLDELRARCAKAEALPLVELSSALRDLPALPLSPEQTLRVQQGQHCVWSEVDVGLCYQEGPVRLLRPDGSLVAVAERGAAGEVSLRRVFNPEAAGTVPLTVRDGSRQAKEQERKQERQDERKQERQDERKEERQENLKENRI